MDLELFTVHSGYLQVSLKVSYFILTWLGYFLKKIRGKTNNLNNDEFYFRVTSKTPSNIRISSKGNSLIKTSEVLLVFYKLILSRFIGLVESFNPKNK